MQPWVRARTSLGFGDAGGGMRGGRRGDNVFGPPKKAFFGGINTHPNVANRSEKSFFVVYFVFGHFWTQNEPFFGAQIGF